MAEKWQPLKSDIDYEICIVYPYQIRRKTNKRIVSEFDNGDGYICCNINKVKLFKHCLIAEQFIPNPNNLPEIDHINHNRADNHIENLRWISRSENCKNYSSSHGKEFIYIDKIDDNAIEIKDYGKYQFEFYYYDEKEDTFYYFNGVKYQKLHINYYKNGDAYIRIYDINNIRRTLMINRFKRLYGINF